MRTKIPACCFAPRCFAPRCFAPRCLAPRCSVPRLLHACSPRLVRRPCFSRSTTSSSASSSPSSIAPPIPRRSPPVASKHSYAPSPFIFQPGFSLFAKRPPRSFPPPFHSPPASSFSDPPSTHNRSRPQRPSSEGADFLRGITNGDDAIVYSPTYLGVADGVGAWNTKSAGHAALWSRLMLHFWSIEVEDGCWGLRSRDGPDPVKCLEAAYHSTIQATTIGVNTVWQGTTTACVAVFHKNTLIVANVGDSQCFVLRPSQKSWLLKTEEQWHWFDCPRQLGTNSPDTPNANAVVSKIDIEDGDIIILASDGLPDNLWEHEILSNCLESLDAPEDTLPIGISRMQFMADRLVASAKAIAIDPFAESPYMERGIEEGLGVEGGKWDDISVVTATCKLNT